MKRDIAATGNKNLNPSTIRALGDDSTLLALRKQMGPSATGFQSGHCSDSISRDSNNSNESVTEHCESSLVQSSSSLTPKPIWSRKRKEFPGSGKYITIPT